MKRRWAALAALVALAPLTVASAPLLYRATHGLEDPPRLSRAAQARALAVARSVVLGSPPPTDSTDDAELQRAQPHLVFVTVFAPGLHSAAGFPSGQGTGTSVLDALRSAAAAAGTALRARGVTVDATQVRIKVDVAGPPRALWMDVPAYVDAVVDPGRDGLTDGTAHVLPSWVVERGASVAQARGTLSGGRVARFRTASFVDGTAEEPGPLELFRGNVLLPRLDAPAVRRALVTGGEYLARHVGADGRYCYNLLVTEDRCDSDYNLLRHAGSTYALFQVHRRFPNAGVLEAAERATGWLREQLRYTDDGQRAYLLEGTVVKLGAAGLGLIALAEREKALGDGKDRAVMGALARMVRSQMREDGFLSSYYAWKPGVPVPEGNSIYYPGEALLGLLRLHDLDPQEAHLDLAEQIAAFLVDRRWRWGGVELQVPVDAWLSQALAELHAKRPDPRWKAYGDKLADAFVGMMLRADEGAALDMAGGPVGGYLLPSSAVAGARNEGITALRLLALQTGDEARQRQLRDAALASAAFQLNQQFRDANSFHLANPARARGGIRGRADDQQVRIDHVQHNISGLLRVLDILEGAP